LPREATLADAVWGGAGVALGVLAALWLSGNLSHASLAASEIVTRIGQTLGAPAEANERVYWYMSRSAGVIAYMLLWGSVIWGLMVTNKMLQGMAKPLLTFELHQFLSILALVFSAFHVFILLGDRYIDFTLADLLIPFRSTYEPLWVGLGVLSFYIVGMLVVSFYVRRRIGHKTWRVLHYASFLAWVMVTLHGLLAGSDSRTTLMLSLYVIGALSVGFLTSYRILTTKPRV
jgi:predicted ferric reductase